MQKTYPRILRGPRTFFNAARTSTLAGGRRTFETRRRIHVTVDVESALLVGRPIGVQDHRVPPELIAETQALRRGQAAPVGGLRRARELVGSRRYMHVDDDSMRSSEAAERPTSCSHPWRQADASVVETNTVEGRWFSEVESCPGRPLASRRVSILAAR